MTKDDRLSVFRNWTKQLSAFEMAISIMNVDENNHAPKQGFSYRLERKSILLSEYRNRLLDKRMFENILELKQIKEIDLYTAKELELYYQKIKQELDIPEDLNTQYNKSLYYSQHIWLEAKQRNDFNLFADAFSTMLSHYKQIVEIKRSEKQSYDFILEQYQPGWVQAKYDSFFEGIKERIIKLYNSINSKGSKNNDSFLFGEFSIEKQHALLNTVTKILGVSDDWSVITESEHPLTTYICSGDIRFTTKYRKTNAIQAVLSTVHESGHAWYGHNIKKEYDGTILVDSISAGFHEAQSRLLENHFGRSKTFLNALLPELKLLFPEQFQKIGEDQMYKAVNAVRTSLIRTEADEVTYPLHIMIRYELEKMLFNDDIAVKEMPEIWNDLYRKYLGIIPQNDSEGVLQDMHWAYAYFGYFPTYALGSAVAAQLYHKLAELIDIEASTRENGSYCAIMEFLGEQYQQYGNLFSMDELLFRFTGEQFNQNYYFSWLENKYSEIYCI